MYTLVGQIINTHGVRGMLKIFPYTDNKDRFLDLNSVYVGEDKEELYIEDIKFQKNLVLIKLKGYNNINEVLKFKQEYLYIKNEDRVKLPENTYFITDLIGLNVIDLQNVHLGIIHDVIINSANDVYVVKNEIEKVFYIPAVKEFIKEVNIEGRYIIIDPIEGMIE